MNSARLQGKRDRRRGVTTQIVKPPRSVNTRQPAGFFPHIANHRLEITTVEQNRTKCEGIQHVLDPIAARIKDSPSVIVPQAWERPGIGQATDDLEHLFNCSVECSRYRNSIQSGKHTGMEEEVERVAMVISRMFEVHAIRPDLALRFAQDNLPSLVLPALSRG